MKKLLKKLNKEQQDYYNFLAHECFAALSNAEDNFKINRFASCATSLFHSAEFFWKSLTILSGKYFETKHEPSQHDMAQISGDLLTSQEKTKAYEILTKFPEIRRTLATYGYYEKGKTMEPPSKVFNRQDTQADLNDVRWMVNKLREIHLCQVFEPPVRVAVLSGYVENTSDEKPCIEYNSSEYKRAKDWVDDLNHMNTPNGKKLFEATLSTIGELYSGNSPVAINPFGEDYPEKGKVEGVGFETITRYIRDGGIFINSGGHPFIYAWDVVTGGSQPVISPIPTFYGFEVRFVENQLIVAPKGTMSVPKEAVLLTRKFGLELIWDIPDKGIVGAKEVDVEYKKRLGEDKVKTKASVFRPVKQVSPDTIPLLRSSTEFWGDVYPMVAVKFGRGFLVHTGMSLNAEREYKILLDIISRIAIMGYENMTEF